MGANTSITSFVLAFGAVLSIGALSMSCTKGEGANCFAAKECAQGLACLGEGVSRCEKCDTAEDCRRDGECTAKDGVCVASSDEECKKAFVCTEQGGCTAKDGKCTVGGDADCKQAVLCAKEGYCIAKGNNCVRPPKEEKPVEEEPETPPDAPDAGDTKDAPKKEEKKGK